MQLYITGISPWLNLGSGDLLGHPSFSGLVPHFPVQCLLHCPSMFMQLVLGWKHRQAQSLSPLVSMFQL